MDEMDRLRKLFNLKRVERYGYGSGRTESSAEHSWSTMILAQFFLKKIKEPLNEHKVMKLILYHDVVEIEAGDTFILDSESKKSQKEKELTAFDVLVDKIPSELYDEYSSLFEEYEAGRTREAMFAKAMDRLEPMIHWLESKPAWKANGFTEQILREKKQDAMEQFPEVLAFFNALVEYLKNNEYI